MYYLGPDGSMHFTNWKRGKGNEFKNITRIETKNFTIITSLFLSQVTTAPFESYASNFYK
ncbi:hypothetical protein TanjilG_15572 [Lupinus angustifolius]|nr:hypothetical protein TanjilG_15572 [Lupinus angustifolius]